MRSSSSPWYENGQKEFEVYYKDGKVEGLAESWYENGQKKGKLNYKDGKRDGLWLEWYDNGQKKLEENISRKELNTEPWALINERLYIEHDSGIKNTDTFYGH